MSLNGVLEEKHLGPNSPRLATGSCIKTVSISNQWRLTTSSSMVLFRWQYSAIHGEVCNLGASLDFITQMLFGTNCNRNISFITSFSEHFSVQEYFVWKIF